MRDDCPWHTFFLAPGQLRSYGRMTDQCFAAFANERLCDRCARHQCRFARSSALNCVHDKDEIGRIENSCASCAHAISDRGRGLRVERHLSQAVIDQHQTAMGDSKFGNTNRLRSEVEGDQARRTGHGVKGCKSQFKNAKGNLTIEISMSCVGKVERVVLNALLLGGTRCPQRVAPGWNALSSTRCSRNAGPPSNICGMHGHHRLETRRSTWDLFSPRRAHHRLEDKTIHLVERVVLNALLSRLFATCAHPLLVAQCSSEGGAPRRQSSEIRLK